MVAEFSGVDTWSESSYISRNIRHGTQPTVGGGWVDQSVPNLLVVILRQRGPRNGVDISSRWF